MFPLAIAAAAGTTTITTRAPRSTCRSSASSTHHHHRRKMAFVFPMVVVLLLLSTTTTTRYVSSVEVKSKSPSSSSSGTYLLDKDTRDDCQQYVDDCSQITSTDSGNDSTFYLSCPITCSKHLHFMGGIGETTKDPDTHYYNQQLNVVVTSGGSGVKSIEPIEDLVDGYVTIFAMLPITSSDDGRQNSGMLQYYYELLFF